MLKELRKIMIEHQKADQLVQGSWWDSEAQSGCFYGCAMHTHEGAIEKAIDKFKIEPWVAYWSEYVFEGLPQELALNWPVELLDAMIAFDGDYSDVYHKLSIKRLESLLFTEDQEVSGAIKQVIKYHKAPSEEKRQAALSEACSAACSAACSSAADSAIYAAEDSSAYLAAYSAAYAAKSAAQSSNELRYTAKEKHWEKERKWMLELLEGE